MIVQLEVVEYRDLEAGMSLVIFEERTARATGAGVCWEGEVGDWKRRPGGESRQEPGDFTSQYFGWKEKALMFVHQVVTCGDF